MFIVLEHKQYIVQYNVSRVWQYTLSSVVSHLDRMNAAGGLRNCSIMNIE